MKTFNHHPLAVIAYLLLTLVLGTYILIIGREILAPLVFAAFFALMLKPVCSWTEIYIPHRVIAILVVFLVVLIVLVGVISAFSIQLVEVLQNMPAISGKIRAGIEQSFVWINELTGFSAEQGREWVQQNLSKVLNAPLQWVGESLSTSSTVAIQFGLMLLYIFFFLWYRSPIKQFLLMQFSKESKDEGREIIQRIQAMIEQYLFGLLTVILILGVLNSLGLWLIGIDYAVFWGLLAASLIVIPYIGTTLGGTLPFIYSIATMTEWWQPLAVVLYYATIQQIEGNLITPNIVGSNVKINPLVAIVSLIIGASIWGIAGMILALPLVAMVKIIFDEIDMLKPIGLMMSNDLLKDQHNFEEIWDDARYRLSKLFKI